MNVLFLTNIPAPYRTVFFNRLGERCNLTVLYERGDAADRESSWLGEKPEHYRAVFLRGIKAGNDSAFSPGALRYLSRKQFDIIVVGGYSTPTGILAITRLRLGGIPYLLNVDGGVVRSDKGLRRWFKRKLIGGAAGYLTSGGKGEEYLRHYGADAPIYRYPFTSLEERDILPGPPTGEERAACKRELGLPSGPLILSVGQFIPRKGFDVLLEAAPLLTGKPTICIAGGEPGPEYREIIREKQVGNVVFPGFLKKEALARYYRAADIFVLPTREDIWGLVVGEAMAYGLPVVATDGCVAGLELIRPGENGYIVPAGQPEPLAGALNQLIGSPALREAFGYQALETIGGYTLEKMAARHLEIFEEILVERGERP